MASQKPKQLVPWETVLQVCVALGVIWIVARGLENATNASGAVVAFVLIGLPVYRFLVRNNARRSLFMKVSAKTDQQMTSLVRRQAQLVRPDAYGKLQLDKWEKEIDYFITHHVGPMLTNEEQAALARDEVEIFRMIDESVDKASREMPVFRAFSDNMTHSEFEIFCTKQLQQSGWNAHATQRSHDQGVDVIAEKYGVRVVLQCKLYSKPVGNKAVQEVVAAKAHEKAHRGAVVTNSRYTPAAEQLAATNGILLLHYSDLANLETVLGLQTHSIPRSNT